MSGWPLKPMGVGRILDQSFQFYRKNFVLIFLVNLIIIGSLMLLQNLLVFDYGGMPLLPSGSVFDSDNFMTGMAAMQGTPSVGRMLVMVFGLIVLVIAAIALLPVVYASVVVLVKSVVQEGMRPGLGETLRGGFRNYWRLLGWSLLFGLILFGVYMVSAVVMGIFMVIIGGAASMGGSQNAAIGVMFVGMIIMLLVILALISFFAIRLGFFLPIIAADNGDNVFSRSWRMTSGNFWRLLAIFLIVHILSYIIVYGFYFVLMITPLFLSIIGQLLLILLTLIVYPMSMVVLAFTYFDLKVRTEGPDLQYMINATLVQPGEMTGRVLETGWVTETSPVTGAGPKDTDHG